MLCAFAVLVQLYSPKRPLVDIAEVFLWLMAVGTILCASYWSAWNAREAAIEQDKLLKVTCSKFCILPHAACIELCLSVYSYVMLING